MLSSRKRRTNYGGKMRATTNQKKPHQTLFLSLSHSFSNQKTGKTKLRMKTKTSEIS